MNTKTVRIAIPVANDKLCLHFGHCQKFAILEVDPSAKKIISRSDEIPPAHEPGVLPAWLGRLGVNMIFAGGMGQRAQALFAPQGIEVLIGLPPETPEALIARYFEETLESGANVCDH